MKFSTAKLPTISTNFVELALELPLINNLLTLSGFFFMIYKKIRAKILKINNEPFLRLFEKWLIINIVSVGHYACHFKYAATSS